MIDTSVKAQGDRTGPAAALVRTRFRRARSVILFDTCDSGTLTGDAAATQQLERERGQRPPGAGDRALDHHRVCRQPATRWRATAAMASSRTRCWMASNRADADGDGAIEVAELAAYVYAAGRLRLSQKIFKQRQAPQMKITENYPLAKQTRILQDDVAPIAEAKPAYQVLQTAQLQIQPGLGATVVRSLSAKTAVTVLDSKDGWALVAADGKPLGYVAARDLAPLQ